jgi:hypothetical protein
MCFRCGHYESDSGAYRDDPEFWKSLIKEEFHKEVKWKKSPNIGQPFTSPEHWTEPLLG